MCVIMTHDCNDDVTYIILMFQTKHVSFPHNGKHVLYIYICVTWACVCIYL